MSSQFPPLESDPNTRRVTDQFAAAASNLSTDRRRVRSGAFSVLSSGWLLVIFWIISRGEMLRQWSSENQFISGDAKYYFWWLNNYSSASQQLREYPVPAVWFLDIFTWPAAGNEWVYVVSLAIGMAGLDILFAVLLWRAGSKIAAWYWVFFGFLMGPIMWFRFDMLSALLVGLAFLWVGRRPGVAGALIGVGAAIKLWPALLMLPLAHRDAAARRRTVSFVATGGLLATASLAATSFQRLVSPLTWQSDRGLQIESIAATPLMLARAFGKDAHTWPIEMSNYNAYEVFGPGVTVLLGVSNALMVLTLVVACVLCWLAWHDRQPHADSLTLAGIAILALLIAANKTLSPQYMLWLGTPLAVLLHHTTSGNLPPGVRSTRRLHALALAGLGLLIAALTQYVFPNHYQEINRTVMHHRIPTAALALRNICTLIMGLSAAWWSMQQLRARRERARAWAAATAGTPNLASYPLGTTIATPTDSDALARPTFGGPDEDTRDESAKNDAPLANDAPNENDQPNEDEYHGDIEDLEDIEVRDQDLTAGPPPTPRRLLLTPPFLARRAAPDSDDQ